MTEKLDQFLHENASPEDPLLEELYRQTHLRFVNPNMSSGHLQGKLLEFISRMIQPKYILEIGTFTGYSAICLSRGLRRGGKLVTIEINDELTSFAGQYFKKAGAASRIIQITGDALKIIPGLKFEFDLAFIDGDKREYTGYFNLVMEKIKPGGFILADNVLWGGKVLDEETGDPQTRGIIEFNRMIRTTESIDRMILPLRDGLALIRKL
jgi:caffeoyl-CoA O-methyltransferase